MKNHTFLAIDLGATSGRSVLLTLADGKIEMQELSRFPNQILEIQGKYYWNVYSIFQSVKEALVLCAEKNIPVESVGVDTWGVDFGYIAADGTLLGLPRAYRDPYTSGMSEEYFKLVSREEVYKLTGIQIMDFNSLFQLFAAGREQFAPLKCADRILFMPDLISYLLTGEMVCEYTDASTSQILNPVTRKFESALLAAAGVLPSLLSDPVMSGTQVGILTESISLETGVGKLPVIAVAGHDTASAIAAVPADNPHFAYLSSGTWSLMGIEVEQPIINEETYRMNFTNEGGIEGTTRFLKNITGMWLLEQCRKEWEHHGNTYTYPQLVEMAQLAVPFVSLVNPDDALFANPKSMTKAIASYCEQTRQPIPQTHAQFIRCIFESLALRYKEVLEMLRNVAPFPISKLHVIGGGSRNRLLNQFTANAIGILVIAGPSEATAIGNGLVQAKAAGLVADRWEMRKIIAASVNLETFTPEDNTLWEEAYIKYQSTILKKIL